MHNFIKDFLKIQHIHFLSQKQKKKLLEELAAQAASVDEND